MWSNASCSAIDHKTFVAINIKNNNKDMVLDLVFCITAKFLIKFHKISIFKKRAFRW